IAWIIGPARPRLCRVRSSRDVSPASVASAPSARGATQWSSAATVACQPPPKASPQPVMPRPKVQGNANRVRPDPFYVDHGRVYSGSLEREPHPAPHVLGQPFIL